MVAMERHPTGGDPPDNIIALSRYRAQLGRGRKLRRADALLSGPDPERAIRASSARSGSTSQTNTAAPAPRARSAIP